MKYNYLLLCIAAILWTASSCTSRKELSSPKSSMRSDDFFAKTKDKGPTKFNEKKGRANFVPPPPPPPLENRLSEPIMEEVESEEEVVGPIDLPSRDEEAYNKIIENAFETPLLENTSTFSIDVDNASYSNIRRYLVSYQQLPPANAVRIEEMINYFDYDYPSPKGKHPFATHLEVHKNPWNTKHQYIHIGIQGKKLDYQNLKSSNLVFLIDASGSMSDPNKLPLLKESLKMLVEGMDDKDRIAIVAYAGAAGLVLPSTSASDHKTIFAALDALSSGGSTAGGAGIELAYKVAKENLIADGNNRVILATDGDFNVGVSDNKSLVKLIEEKRKDNIYLTICGFGMGNYKDDRMEMISNAGNGNYFYIDNRKEAEKVFVREMRANMFTIAKDVKLQVEFNPDLVQAYRLVGYENRVLENKDFEDDTKDAGELGAGHTVTAIYEIIPKGVDSEIVTKLTDSIKGIAENLDFEEGMLMKLNIRYKPLDSETSILMTEMLKNNALQKSSENFQFSAAVIGAGLLFRNSAYKGTASFQGVEDLALQSKGVDKSGDRMEFIKLIGRAKSIETTGKK